MLVRDYLTTPGLRLRLVNLPGYSPDFNADEAVLVRQEATGNLCLGTKPLVQEKVRNFFDRLACRQEEVKRRHRTVLQSRAEELLRHAQADSHRPANAHPTLALARIHRRDKGGLVRQVTGGGVRDCRALIPVDLDGVRNVGDTKRGTLAARYGGERQEQQGGERHETQGASPAGIRQAIGQSARRV